MSAQSDLTLRNGLVVTPRGTIRGGLAVKDGVITYVGPDATIPAGATDLDVGGKVIFPGAIDPHSHMGVGHGWGPEKMQRDFATESRDAAAGGITTMITTSLLGRESRVEVVEGGLEWGNANSHIDFRLTAVITLREHMREVAEVAKMGVRSFKLFLGYRGSQAMGFGMEAEGIPWDFFYQACEALGESGAKVFPTIHAEDPHVRDYLVEHWRGKFKNGLLQTWLEACPNILEPMQIYPAALIAHEVGVPLYVVHTSAWQSVDLLEDLKQRGLDIHGETLGAFLYWTADEADAKDKGTYGKIQPPIRLNRDREALWKGIRNGTMTSVGTDCQMYSAESRHVDFWDAQVGLGPQMGTLLPSLYTCGVLRGRCTLEDLARVLAENNARRFDLYPTKGVLQPGSDADIVVLDTEHERVVRAEELQSAGGYNLYEGESLRGWPEQVYVRGNLVLDRGRIVPKKPLGRHVPPVGA